MTFVLIHGAGDVSWYWHLVERELRALGHDVIAPDLPCDDDGAGLEEYAQTVISAVGARKRLAIVAQSFGGFTAPIVADRLGAEALILVAAMIPRPGERPDDYWKNTGYREAVEKQSARDGGVTGHQDPYVLFYHDVPRRLAESAMRRGRSQSATPGAAPWPLDAWPRVRTKCVICTEDRFFPAGYLRRVVEERLGVLPDEIAAGHCVALSRPRELTAMLNAYTEP